jgi:hypothetical protein
MFNKSLWETSGHWENYKEDMYTVRSGCCDHGEKEGEEEGEVSLLFFKILVLLPSCPLVLLPSYPLALSPSHPLALLPSYPLTS